MPVGPLCYTVHADSYLRIENPKKHMAYGGLFHWGPLVNSQDARHLGLVPLSRYIRIFTNYCHKEKLEQSCFWLCFFVLLFLCFDFNFNLLNISLKFVIFPFLSNFH